MTIADRWLLPDGMEEVLPVQAQQVEALRRLLLDHYKSWSYELVIPPLMEFTESLLIGVGQDIDLYAFKVTDQLSGRSMAIRPDMTPQTARIDAHSLKREGPVRLCYAGSVLHTKAKSLLASRSPIQIGAELFGHEGLDGDIEIISLMLDTLNVVGISDVHLDLGHVGIYRAIIAEAGLNPQRQDLLFDALQRKASTEIEAIIGEQVASEQVANWLRALAKLNGGQSILLEAKSVLSGAPAAVFSALEELISVSAIIAKRMPEVVQHFDLSELRGYQYHTGLLYAALVPGHGQALANGGRYNDIGAVFGRSRAATGFSADLKALVTLVPKSVIAENIGGAIFAPQAPSAADDIALWQMIKQLRSQGETVVCALAGQTDDGGGENFRRILQLKNGEWQLQEK